MRDSIEKAKMDGKTHCVQEQNVSSPAEALRFISVG